MPSSSIGEHTAVFEPIHGSYPQAKGKNIANPMAIVLSIAMMFDHLGYGEVKEAIETAVKDCIDEGIVTEDLSTNYSLSCTTDQVGEFISALIKTNVTV
jgi:3-isopropylmalate dehydrogenase